MTGMDTLGEGIQRRANLKIYMEKISFSRKDVEELVAYGAWSERKYGAHSGRWKLGGHEGSSERTQSVREVERPASSNMAAAKKN